jgi:hypothetical protein
MRKFILASVALAALAGAASAETRDISGFTEVSAADRIEVEVSIGDRYSVQVTGADADKVTTRVDDGRLIIRRTNRPFWGGTPAIDATVRVTAPQIDSLASSRGAELRATGLNARSMSLAAAMGGTLHAEGACTNLDASAAMGGSIRAEDLRCETADISAAMGGDARVYASNHFDASAAMGGSVNVAGGADGGDINTTMGGSVDRD